MDKSPIVAGEIQVGLAAGKNTFADTEIVTVQFFIENNTDKSFTFLAWGTPLEEPMTADGFDVLLNDQPVPYIGIMVKRKAPVDADYLELPGGKRVEQSVELSRSYDMTLPGNYTVQLKISDGAYKLGSESLQLATTPVEIVRLTN